MRLSIGLLAAIGLASVIGACGDHPTAPDSGSGPGRKTVSRLRVSGPSSVAPGTTAQFTATADYTDGSTEDVTTSVLWGSSSPSTLLAPQFGFGTATARARGESVLTATYQVTSPGLQVLVLEPGTFKISGSVTESGSPVLRGATVEVTDGIGAGLKTGTNASGRYALYGVAGNIRLRVSALGYVSTIREMVVGNSEAVSDFNMAPEASPVDLRGKWTLTLSAATECSDKLSDDARVRTFDTTVAQAGAQLVVTMENPSTGPVIRPPAVMADKKLTLTFWKFSYYGEPGHLLFERLDSNRWLGIAGTVETMVTGPEIRAQLNGEFVTYKDVTFRSAVETGACMSNAHGFTMRRQ